MSLEGERERRRRKMVLWECMGYYIMCNINLEFGGEIVDGKNKTKIV